MFRSRKREEDVIAYRIKKSDHDVVDAVRRIAGEQLDRAIASVDDDEGELEPRVHDVRKRMKKLRGLIRLVRPAFPDYRRENAHFRDTARSISGVRDAQVLLSTLDALLENHEEPLDAEAFADFRGRIEAEARETREVDLEPVREALARARERLGEWTLRDTGWDAVAGGLKKTYKRARKRQSATSDADLHDWRKRLKYHWYHVRLLRDIWPEEMEAREAAADKIGDDMGLYQDLVVLDAEVAEGPLSEEAARVLHGLIEARKAEKLADARGIADRLLADKPKVLVARWGELWEAWRS